MRLIPTIAAGALLAGPAAAPNAHAETGVQHFRFEISTADLAHTRFTLAMGPDGKLVAGTNLVTGTPVDTCVTISTGSAGCTGLGASAGAVLLGDTLVIEGLALSLSNPGGATVAFSWNSLFGSGVNFLACDWTAGGGLAGIVISGGCAGNGNFVPPGGPAAGVVSGTQTASGVLTHTAVIV